MVKRVKCCNRPELVFETKVLCHKFSYLTEVSPGLWDREDGEADYVDSEETLEGMTKCINCGSEVSIIPGCQYEGEDLFEEGEGE